MPQDIPTNPLLQRWDTPYGLPPFDLLSAQHFVPAFEAALKAHREELDTIAAQTAAPTFENTIAAFDKSGRLLSRIEALFENLTSSETSPALQAAERELAAPLAAHGNAIYMHAALFARVDALYQRSAVLGLEAEQLRTLERIHLDFVRAGAELAPAAQARYARIMERLAELTTRFTQNVLAAEANFQLVLRRDEDIAGLPESLLAAAKNAALERGVNDAYVITLSRSLITPFLTFSARRDLREQAFKAWTQRGSERGPHDNLPVAVEIMQLRLDQAQLHGYSNYSDYALADMMASTRKAVDDLLMRVWEPAKAKAAAECEALKEMAIACGERIDIEPWDWRHYAEKVRAARYDLDESAIKPYFPLERMVQAIFDCANRLFGLTFIEKPQIKAYHPDVKVYEVRDGNAANRLIGVFLHDNFARATKRGGAWMNSYRLQSRIEGNVLPIVVNNNNFAKGPPGEPTLLSFDDARILFHEFGHGLHGLLSNVHYERLSGTRVLRDFVELPSQLFEHWLGEPQVLKRFARHYQTNETISDELIGKLKKARTFNQGFENVEFVSSALVDMALHSRSNMDDLDLNRFEAEQLARIGMPKEIVMRHRLPHFQHLFSGPGYASGYYVYLWAAVLDADGFEAFVEAGSPFDGNVAARLRKFIYSSGNTMSPMDAYRAFRGQDPKVEPMLRQKGLVAGYIRRSASERRQLFNVKR